MKEPKYTIDLAWPRSKKGPANIVMQQVRKACIEPIQDTVLLLLPGMSVVV